MPNDKQSPMAQKLAATLERARDTLSDHLLELGQKKTTESVEVSYNVVFTGKLTQAEPQAIANMANFFKLGNDSAKRLLQKGRVLKSYPNKAQADKLAVLLTRTGAECRVEMEMPVEEDAPSAIQKAAFALQGVNIPILQLPDYHQFQRKHWLTLGSVATVLAAVLLWLLLSAPVIHGDTASEYEASVQRMLEHTDPAQAPVIRSAIALLTDNSRKAQSESGTTNPDIAAQLIYAPVEGKNATQILVEAEARLEKQRAALRQGIADADQKIAAADQKLAEIAPGNRQVLEKIEVISAAFGWPLGATTPTLAFALRNNSSENLMRVYLQGYLYDANGLLIVSNPLTYSIASGINSGSSASASLPTLKDSPWATQAAYEKNGLVLKLRVANAENLQGKQLGTDYRPIETEKQRYLDWKAKVQAQLDAVKL